MSKQTNAFQKLIHHIHSKIENTTATVAESASLIEKNIAEPIAREIDVFIEKEVNGKKAKIAIECRDRSDKDDIEWVDCLVGKYKNLDVHKVIAVSNAGYSRSARLKARANGIELKTIDEAFEIDFDEEFVKLGMTFISHNFELKERTIRFNPLPKVKPTPETVVYHDGCAGGTLDELTKICYEEGTKKKLMPYYKQNFLNIFKTRADIDKQMLIKHTIPINDLYIESNGEKFYITSITFTLIGKPTVQEISVRHRTYEGALIAEGVFDIKIMDKIQTTWIAQFPKNKEASVFVKSKPRKKRKNV